MTFAQERRGVRSRPESPGFPGEIEQHEGGRRASSEVPLSAGWITEDLLRETRQVFTNAYGRVVTAEEAVEILMNIRRLACALIKAKTGGEEG